MGKNLLYYLWQCCYNVNYKNVGWDINADISKKWKRDKADKSKGALSNGVWAVVYRRVCPVHPLYDKGRRLLFILRRLQRTADTIL